jgi:hypothetical protein
MANFADFQSDIAAVVIKALKVIKVSAFAIQAITFCLIKEVVLGLLPLLRR